jgi:hypothetical protein
MEYMKERDLLGGLGIKDKIIIKVDLREIWCGFGCDSSDSGQGPVAGSYEHSNKPPGSMKGREFLY